MNRPMVLATLSLVVVLGGAFAGASLTQNDPIFSLSPPPPKGAPAGTVVPPDVPATQRLDLHRTFFTAWAAVLLVTPALCAYPFRRWSPKAAAWWRAYWTVACAAFLVHFYFAVFVIFGNDWSRITNSTRVSAAIPDAIFAVWWLLDVVLAWAIASENRPIRVERAIVTLAAFVLFFAGAALQGEIWLSKAIGYAMGAAVAISLVVWLVRRRSLRNASVAYAT